MRVAAGPDENRPAIQEEEKTRMTSVNTNVGALLAQKFLRSTASDLVTTQNRVSSGLRVSTVTDDASSFAVASGIRGDIKAYVAVAAALQGSQVAATVAISAGETISNRVGDIKAKLVQLSDESLSSASRDTYQTDLDSMVAEVNDYLAQAAYSGRNLLGSGGTDLLVVSNIDGTSVTVGNNDVTDLAFAGDIADNADAQDALSTLAVFKAGLDTALANLGADLSRLKSQTEFIKQTQETVQIGLGALVDADLAKESSTLTSLQVRQQLGVQAIGIANSAPQTLLGLFR
jgi:flagellin